MAEQLKKLASARCFGGSLQKWEHQSTSLGLPAKFSIFLPESASSGNPVNVVYWLSGLTCTEDNFVQKAGAQRAANEHRLALVCPDTSPREAKVPGEDDSYDFGSGAGFYVDATTEGWNRNYKMYSYVVNELPALIEANFPVTKKKSIFGHSMGGHGALSLYLRNPGMYESVSAFAPICNPTQCAWGKKAFTGYLGDDQSKWEAHDSTLLVGGFSGERKDILIDQGKEDGFLKEGQLRPEAFAEACQKANHPLTLRMQDGYDHSYYFIATFVDDHIRHHAQALNG